MLPTASPVFRRWRVCLEGFPGFVSVAGVELGIFLTASLWHHQNKEYKWKLNSNVGVMQIWYDVNKYNELSCFRTIIKMHRRISAVRPLTVSRCSSGSDTHETDPLLSAHWGLRDLPDTIFHIPDISWSLMSNTTCSRAGLWFWKARIKPKLPGRAQILLCQPSMPLMKQIWSHADTFMWSEGNPESTERWIETLMVFWSFYGFCWH